MRPIGRRGHLLSATGFCVAGLGLLLPFGAVSCGYDPKASATTTYSGADLIGNRGGTISVTPDLLASFGGRSVKDLDPQPDPSRFLAEAHTRDLRILLVAFIAAIVAGMLAAAARSALGRVTFAAAFSAAGLIVMIGARIAARHAVSAWFAAQQGTSSTGFAVHAGAGFWLSVSVLAAVTVGNLVAILWHTRDRPPDDALTSYGDMRAPV